MTAARPLKVLVTGAEEHQGLAIVRGLGLRGVPVVACGLRTRGLGLVSRYATERYTYPHPSTDRAGFTAAVEQAIAASGATLVIPGVETALVALDAERDRIERLAPLAAPSSETLALALDKARTIAVAEACGVAVPRTAHAATIDGLLEEARTFRFPVAIKPRGPARFAGTEHGHSFKVRYAATLDALRAILAELALAGDPPLVQEFATGTGLCVSALFDRGEPLGLFTYTRDREVPLGGGVSVLRTSVPTTPRVHDAVVRLLRAMRWHGVAMVEFKHDVRTDALVLMEVNGRFQASTALCVDAGMNLPWLVACLFTGRPVDVPASYRLGVRERWLRGDVTALVRHLSGEDREPSGTGLYEPPSNATVLLDFLRAFAPSMRYDEFRISDPLPGIVEGTAVAGIVARAALGVAKRGVRKLVRI